MKDRKITLTFPLMILIEVLTTWFIGHQNTTIGIIVGIVSIVHIITIYVIGRIIKNKQKNNERLD